MTAVALLNPLEKLAATPASDLKRLGWRGVMKGVAREGTVVVTNHREPEAVILSIQAYSDLVRASEARTADQESGLALLSRRFDERLAALNAPDAADRLRTLIDRPGTLGGQVKAGASY